MPVYVCAPGSGAVDPWRHGIQVYQRPVDIDSTATTTTTTNNSSNNHPYDRATGTAETSAATNQENSPVTNNQGNSPDDDEDDVPERVPRFRPRGFVVTATTGGGAGTSDLRSSVTSSSASNNLGVVRRVRHAEIVLVDDVCIAHGRYWLRLRWPGHKGGFAGYIAMGRIHAGSKNLTNEEQNKNIEGKKRLLLQALIFLQVQFLCLRPCSTLTNAMLSIEIIFTQRPTNSICHLETKAVKNEKILSVSKKKRVRCPLRNQMKVSRRAVQSRAVALDSPFKAPTC